MIMLKKSLSLMVNNTDKLFHIRSGERDWYKIELVKTIPHNQHMD